MAQQKKILVSLPDNLLKEVDSIVRMEEMKRSEFIREAMKLYIREKKKLRLRESMIKGYQYMADINTKLAEDCFDADSEQLKTYEERLRRWRNSGVD